MCYYDIFLSYAYNDREYARLLRIRLSEETPKFHVWFDETNIFLGNNLEHSIRIGLENSHYGIILLSRDYLNFRRWTDLEFNILKNGRIFLITHKIELEEIETEYPDVYEVIREIRLISTNSHTDFVLSTVKEVVGDSIVREKREFTPLRNLLADKDWYRADTKTSELVNKNGGILEISHENLNLLNYLWLKYSRNDYGFSIQREIYQRCCRSSRDDLESYNRFYTDVNWPAVSNSHHTNIPQGHFPSLTYFSKLCQARDTGTLIFVIFIVVMFIILIVSLIVSPEVPQAAAGALFIYIIFGGPVFLCIARRRHDSEERRIVREKANVLKQFFQSTQHLFPNGG